MVKLLRIFLTGLLALFMIFVWPYVFITLRDLLLHKGRYRVYEEELEQKPIVSNVTSACPSVASSNCTACPRELQNGSAANGVAHNFSFPWQNNEKIGAGKPNIAIITVFILPKDGHFVTDHSQLRFDHVMESFLNKFKYAHYYNYEFIPIFWNFKDPDLPGAWAKIPALQRYLPYYDWVWSMDVDAFVTNRRLSIEEHVLKHIPLDKAVVIARDCNHLNTGSFLIRNTPRAFQFLDAVYSLRRNTSLHLYDIWYEQSAVIHVFDHDIEGLTSTFHLIPQQKLNSYSSNCGHTWQLRDFVVHFPGQAEKSKAWANLLRKGGAELQELLP
ncbi:hypothetical protein VOLCADRAFT_103321 [Volvox carteri f. nagariensis]|uniref:Uncharacterized protein n=1 Tax=Volvox carteri f. nagariensis TaxID=3068 RepID=D8TL87_VOLCA|nr:uncharacterized protein VOLCADRAFT_103321 [Volvox carteri f. nagariensis]EFJ51693.1 hypothetical protein VOLCADRAFT_103321 [Volvox carteri f. nagariensis]|eukprot:XP_002947103.1 hypothetical protein VOLCADRAFT_103321 [Volvox carteri f. nagariensis]